MDTNAIFPFVLFVPSIFYRQDGGKIKHQQLIM